MNKILIFLFAAASLFADYQAKDFSYLLGKVPGLDDALLKMHFTLYRGYVKNTNALQKALEEMGKKGEDRTVAYGALKRRFAWEFDGMVLHQYYFENLGAKPLSKKSPLFKKIVSDFGSFEAWQKNFVSTGMIRGVGWVILYQDPIDGLFCNIWVDEHNINHIPGGKPLLIMDVWEHAYITEYGLNRLGYIQTFLKNINWDIVEKRFSE